MCNIPCSMCGDYEDCDIHYQYLNSRCRTCKYDKVDFKDKKNKCSSCIGFCINPNGVDNYAKQ